MQTNDERPKRAYSKPKIERVQLNHEQAVLSQCSSLSTSMAQSNPSGWCTAAAPGCRKRSMAGGTDSLASS